MLCKHPYVRDPTGKALVRWSPDKADYYKGIPFPCGQCLPCRINKRRVWTHRMMLESFCHADACFVTLTYDPEHLPVGATLVKRDLQLFLKRLRKALDPIKIRYYAAGEYGEHTKRPHYHLALFGIGSEFTELINCCWSRGLVHIGELTHDSAQYIAGYVTKKIVKKEDLHGRTPEFAVMSRRPGIGYPALDDVVALLRNPRFRDYFHLDKDVPDGLLHGKSFQPFGRYLKDKLRQLMEVEGDPEPFLFEMRQKYLEAKQAQEPLAHFLVREAQGKVAHIEHRFKIFNKRNQI